MDYRNRRRIAVRLALLLPGLVLAIVLGWDVVSARRQVMRPLIGGGMLLLVLGPVLIGNYLAGRKGRPPLS